MMQDEVEAPAENDGLPKRLYRWWLITIIIAYFILSLIYVLSTPPLEASDEYKHYPVVQHIESTFELPVLDPEDPGLWLQEAAQPPLYYLLMAAATAIIDTSDLEEIHQVNPHAFVGNPNQIANKNLIIHDEAREAFPWSGSILAIYIIRLVSSVLGAGTVFLTARLGAFLFNQTASLLAAALTAFNPMFIFVNSAVNNDSLAILLGTIALLLLVNLWRDRPYPGRSWWTYALIGLVIGLCILTKISLGALAALAIIVIFLLAWIERRPSFLLGGAIILSVSLLITLPWFARNFNLYEDPFGLSAFIQVQGSRDSPITLSDWQGEFGTLFRSYWGLFGGVNVAAPEGFYLLFNILALIGAVGIVIWLWRHRSEAASFFQPKYLGTEPETDSERQPPEGVVAADRILTNNREQSHNLGAGREDHRGVWLLFIWPLILSILLIRWNVISPAFQGRLLFPAISAINVLWSVGLLIWIRQRHRRIATTSLALVVFAAALWLPWAIIRPAYSMPQSLAEVPSDFNFGPITFASGSDTIQLVGVEFANDQTVTAQGDPVELSLYWRATDATSKNYLSTVHLLGRGNESVGQVNRYPASGMVPSTRWQNGQIWRDDYHIYVRGVADAPSRLNVRVSLFDTDNGKDLQASGPEGIPIELLIVGEARLIEAGEIEYRPENELDIAFSDGIILQGYDIEPSVLRPGEELTMTLYWEVEAAPAAEYSVFIHLLDNEGNPALISDGPPVVGYYPTTLWQAGEQIRDEHLLLIPETLPPGSYSIFLGLYEPATLMRLPRADGFGDAVTWPVVVQE